MSKAPLSLADVLGHDMIDKRIDILRRIGEAGSISEAARGAGVSYKAAWQAIEALTNLAGQPLVSKTVGGSGGGGAVLTPAGQQVLSAAQALAAARQQIMARYTRSHDDPGPAVLTLRTSMRNQMPCRVTALGTERGQVSVTLQLADGASLVSRITPVSAQLLGLQPGLDVLVMCKATAIQMRGSPPDTAGVNVLRGTVRRTGRQAGGEVTLETSPGIRLVGYAAPDFTPRSGLKAYAAVAASALVIGALY
jgi:molybdate transport system regulatory protein